MIHGFNIQAQGTAFTAVSASVTNRTEKQMSEEEIFSSGNKNTDNIKTSSLADKIASDSASAAKEDNISYNTKVNNGSKLVFTDPTNGKYAIVSLSDKTVDALKSYFGESDFYKRDDGFIRLDNKAEAYVAGWFGDIAYKREFLSADSNSDGKLTTEEYRRTLNSFNIEGSLVNATITEKVTNTYTNVSGLTYRENNYAKSLDDELDMTLSINKDMNNSISLKEAYNADTTGNYEEVIYRHAKEELGKYLEDLMFDEKARKLEEKNSQKAIAANVDKLPA